jgi:hypothetical protein
VRAGKYRYRLISQYMEQVPIPTSPPKELRSRIANMTADLLRLYREHDAAKAPQTKVTLERQIAAASDEVDRLVYELYGLTDSDAAVIDGSVGSVHEDEE